MSSISPTKPAARWVASPPSMGRGSDVRAYLGCDPGLSGALALLTPSQVRFWDMPVDVVQKGNGTRREYAERDLYWLITNITDGLLDDGDAPRGQSVVLHAVVEQVQARPGMGAVPMLSLGLGFGIIRGVLTGFPIAVEFVRPNEWKKAMGVGKGKDESRRRALQLFPQCIDDLQRKKDNGRADALLLAEWLRRKTET